MAKGIIDLLTQEDCIDAKPKIVKGDPVVTKFNAGSGLSLVVTPRVDGTHTSSWVLRYRIAGDQTKMGLGPFPEVSLDEARLRAQEQRRLKNEGKNPLDEKRKRRAEQKRKRERRRTFNQCVTGYLESEAKPTWRSKKYSTQWRTELDRHASKVFGSKYVDEIDIPMVLQALKPLWGRKMVVTGKRVQGRIQTVLDWAAAPDQGYRQGENPARWALLRHSLGSPRKVRKVKHLAALDYREMGALMSQIRAKEGQAWRALEFAILVCCRSGEVNEMVWSEVDLENAVWTIPEERMKADREQRVPLSDAAHAVLKTQRDRKLNGNAVWPPIYKGRRVKGKFQAESSMRDVLQSLVLDVTLHGCRTSFRMWAADRTAFPETVCEMVLAHEVGTDTEKAYQRSDLFDHRRELMTHWANYLSKPEPKGHTADIIPFHTRIVRTLR